MRAVLFDLDGTLLDIDIDAFMRRYLQALSEHCESAYPGLPVIEAVLAGTDAMMREHPGVTNRDAFHAVFEELTGIDIGKQWGVFERFYAERFPALRGDAVPRKGGLKALDSALALGLKTAVATNPMFPATAIATRMAWAGLDGHPVDLVTSYEEFRACKPHVAYFRQVAEMLDVDPAQCLMVGDDPDLDIGGAAAAGMRTFYVGTRHFAGADHCGDLGMLAAALPGLAAS